MQAQDSPPLDPANPTGAAGTTKLLKAKQAPDIEIKKNDIWVGYHRRGANRVPANSWVPLHLIIKNNSKEMYDGELFIYVKDARSGNKYTSLYSTPVALLGRGTKKHIATHIYIPELDYGMSNTEFNSISVSMIFKSTTHIIAPHEVMVSTVASSQQRRGSILTRERILALSNSSLSALPAIDEFYPEVKHRVVLQGDVESLPLRWTAYAGFDAIIWDGMDVSGLSTAQSKALLDYVAGGGDIIIAAGNNRALIERSILKKMLPCTIGKSESRDAVGELTSGIATRSELCSTLIPNPGSISLVNKFIAVNKAETPGENDRDEDENSDDAEYIWTTANIDKTLAVRGDYGAGSVTVLAFNLTDRIKPSGESGLDASKNTAKDWSEDTAGVFSTGSSMADTENMEMNYLAQDNLEASAVIRIPPKAEVAAFMIIYFIILCPLCYGVFRFWQKLEYAWIMMIVISLGFFSWTFGGAMSSIGEAVSISDFSLVQTGSDGTSSTLTYSMIHNPTYNKYDISFPNQTVTPNHMRYDKPPSAYEYQEESFDISFTERSRSISINKFEIGFNTRRSLSSRAVVQNGAGLSADINWDKVYEIRSNSDSENMTPIGSVDNRTGVNYSYGLLIFGNNGMILNSIPKGNSKLTQFGTREPAKDINGVIDLLGNIARIDKNLLRAAILKVAGDNRRPRLLLLGSYSPFEWNMEGKSTPSSGKALVFYRLPYNEAWMEDLTPPGGNKLRVRLKKDMDVIYDRIYYQQ
ncbi:MAG: hypothetical protein JXR97_00630 [Planctomycetes bacterium]|nr:hypothetical protein [Planctomycetota bacterium]